MLDESRGFGSIVDTGKVELPSELRLLDYHTSLKEPMRVRHKIECPVSPWTL